MTSNGVLLKKYIGYLVEKDFDLLISLDGNKTHNAYRIFKRNKKESFDIISRNLLYVKKRYPTFYRNKVGINSVIHNLSDKKEIYDYIFKTYNKRPEFTNVVLESLKSENIKAFKKKFMATGKKNDTSINYNEDYEIDSLKSSLTIFIGKMTNYFTKDLNSLLYPNKFSGKYTGTCIPFSKKIFVTSKGLILPCENIEHKHYLGRLNNGQLDFDIKQIAKLYNKYIVKSTSKCEGCYRIYDCEECFYKLP
jgi:uncharacterized protein